MRSLRGFFYKGSPRKVSARGFLARSSCHKTSCTGFVQKPCALMHNTFAWPFAQRFDSYPVHLRCFAVGHGLTRSVISRQNVYSHLIFQQFSEYSCAEIPAHVRFQTTRQRDTCAKKKCDDAISHFHRHQVPLLTPLHSQNECSGEKGRKKTKQRMVNPYNPLVFFEPAQPNKLWWHGGGKTYADSPWKFALLHLTKWLCHVCCHTAEICFL